MPKVGKLEEVIPDVSFADCRVPCAVSVWDIVAGKVKVRTSRAARSCREGPGAPRPLRPAALRPLPSPPPLGPHPSRRAGPPPAPQVIDSGRLRPAAMAASAVPGLFAASPPALDGIPVVNCALGDLRGLAAAGPAERVLNVNLFRGFNVPLPPGRADLVSLSLKCAAAAAAKALLLCFLAPSGAPPSLPWAGRRRSPVRAAPHARVPHRGPPEAPP